MTVQVTQVTDLLIEKHLEHLGEDTELIFLFGSRIRGTAHPNSDMDLCYTPVHGSTWAHTTVIVDGILFDLFPQNWWQLEKAANFDDPGTSKILDAQIVYHRSEEALARFHALQDRIRQLMQPESRPQMIAKAQSIFQKAGYPFLQLQLAAGRDDLLSAKTHARHIVSAINHSLMVVNQTCIDTRRPQQVITLPILPEDYEALHHQIYSTTDARNLAAACETLLGRTRTLLLTEQESLPQHPQPYAQEFCSLYPELKDMIQHILRGCEAQDSYITTDAVLFVHEELAPTLARVLTGASYTAFHTPADYHHHLTSLGFPDLLPSLIAGDYPTLHQQALVFDRRLRELLISHSVPLNDFSSAQELSDYLSSYTPKR